MDLREILLVTMLASGFLVVASFYVEEDLKHQNWEESPDSNGCGFCSYYFQTGLSPYGVLWKFGAEVQPHMSLKSRILMLTDPGRLKIAEYFFRDFCDKFCGRGDIEIGQETDVVPPCQRENGITNYNHQ